MNISEDNRKKNMTEITLQWPQSIRSTELRLLAFYINLSTIQSIYTNSQIQVIKICRNTTTCLILFIDTFLQWNNICYQKQTHVHKKGEFTNCTKSKQALHIKHFISNVTFFIKGINIIEIFLSNFEWKKKKKIFRDNQKIIW